LERWQWNIGLLNPDRAFDSRRSLSIKQSISQHHVAYASICRTESVLRRRSIQKANWANSSSFSIANSILRHNPVCLHFCAIFHACAGGYDWIVVKNHDKGTRYEYSSDMGNKMSYHFVNRLFGLATMKGDEL